MSIKNPEIYQKYFGSHIFNDKLNPEEGIIKIEKGKYKYRPTYGKTKEDVFNITPEKRIKRKEDENEIKEKERLNKSAIKRKKIYGTIFGSDIFNQQKPPITERKKGIKSNQNNMNNKSVLYTLGNNEEYIKDLKYYTSQHRKERKEYNPDKYLKKFNAKKKNLEVHFKVGGKNYLITEVDNKNPYNEKRYFKQKRIDTNDRKRYFADKIIHNISKINKQIQNESYIFTEDNKIKTIEDEANEIKNRIELQKNKKYNINVLGVPYNEVKRDLSFDLKSKGNHEIYDILSGEKKETPKTSEQPDKNIGKKKIR